MHYMKNLWIRKEERKKIDHYLTIYDGQMAYKVFKYPLIIISMEKKDILLLAELRKNARESLTHMSKKTGIPISTIYDKLKHFHQSIITKHVTLVDFSDLGFSTRANMLLKVPKDKRPLLCEFLLKHNAVNSAFKINNGYDYHIECLFRTLKEMEDFTEYLEEKFSIRDKKIYFLIEDIKRETFMENPSALGLT